MVWPLEATVTLTHDDYTVAWICALPIEKVAARNMLDELHITPPQSEHDKNIYTFGRICGHNVVIVCQGDIGTTAASIMATRMDSTFRRLRFGLLVGIAGGVPEEKDIRLGDVVVSKGDGRSGGVVAHDRGKMTLIGLESRPFLNGVPEVLRNAFSELESRLMDQDSKITTYLSEATARNARFSAFERPISLTDDLFHSDYPHVNLKNKTCADCAKDRIVGRPPRADSLIHFGIVASGNQVIKNAAERSRISTAHPGVLAVEMAAAGLMDIFGCATIRGICNYADSHKNDGWQMYASATAAAVAKEVLEIIPAAIVVAASPTAVAGIPISHWLVPFPRNERFVGRNWHLDQLATKLSSDQFCQRVAITGLGGVGKTQIVLEYAYRIKKKSPECSVFWILASSNVSFEKGYSDIAECLKITGITKENANVKQLVKTALSQESTGPWILIIDNADDVDVLFKNGDDLGSLPLIDYLPASCKGSIIFTTRTRKAAVKQAGGDIIQIDEMSRDDAKEFLRMSLRRTDLLNENAAVIKLCKLLAYLPLALTQAVSYINMNDIPISQYIGLYEGSEEDIIEVLSVDFEDQGRYREMRNPVAATWLISFRKICQQDDLAGEYLSFMACLVRQNIPQSLLPIPSSKKKAIDAIGTLTAYSFITKHDLNNLFDVHRLVHLATRQWLRNENKLIVWTDRALIRLADIFPSGDHENRAIWSTYLPHACNILAQHRLEAMSETTRITLLDNIGWCLENTGQYREAEKIHRQVQELRIKVLGPEHPDTLMSMCYVAAALREQGNYREAEQIHRQELELCSKILGPEHPDTLTSISYIAAALSNQGNYREAKKMHRQVLELRIKVLGPKHPNTLASMYSVAAALSNQGNYREAEKMHRQVQELRIKVLGPEHPDTLTSISHIAAALGSQGNYREAEQIHRQVLELRIKVLGPEHPDTLTSIRYVAAALSEQGNYREAEQIHRQVLELRTKVSGPEHPDTLASMCYIAAVLSEQGNYQEAEQIHRQVLELQMKILGPEHPDTLTSMCNVAAVLSNQGNYREAEQIHRQELELCSKVLGPKHPDTLTSMYHLAVALSGQGNYREAEQIHRHVLELRIKVLGPEHPETLRSTNILAKALKDQEMYPKLKEIHQKMLTLTTKAPRQKAPFDDDEQEQSQTGAEMSTSSKRRRII
ncbi:hypothetical protein ACMFMG_000914 [Clarireedia jacksonii]